MGGVGGVGDRQARKASGGRRDPSSMGEEEERERGGEEMGEMEKEVS